MNYFYQTKNGLYQIEHDGYYTAPWVIWKYDLYTDSYTIYIASYKTLKGAQQYLIDRGGKRV